MILQTNNAGLFGRFVGQVSTIASVVGGSYRPVVLLNDPEVNGRVVARSGFISAGAADRESGRPLKSLRNGDSRIGLRIPKKAIRCWLRNTMRCVQDFIPSIVLIHVAGSGYLYDCS